MLRIIICSHKTEEAKTLFELSAKILRKLAVKCELFNCTDFQIADKNISEDIYYYNILILDASDTDALNIAKKV